MARLAAAKHAWLDQICSSFQDCSNDENCCEGRCLMAVWGATVDCSKTGESCCSKTCVNVSNCLGLHCNDFSDCANSLDEICCNSKCVTGSNCFGQSCNCDSDCDKWPFPL